MMVICSCDTKHSINNHQNHAEIRVNHSEIRPYNLQCLVYKTPKARTFLKISKQESVFHFPPLLGLLKGVWGPNKEVCIM